VRSNFSNDVPDFCVTHWRTCVLLGTVVTVVCLCVFVPILHHFGQDCVSLVGRETDSLVYYIWQNNDVAYCK
jgi:hypothetical protein